MTRGEKKLSIVSIEHVFAFHSIIDGKSYWFHSINIKSGNLEIA